MKRPKRRHPQPRVPRGPQIDELLAEIDALREEGKYEEILKRLDEAPLYLQHRPELMVLRGMALLSLGDVRSARDVFEETVRRTNGFPLATALLGITYDMMGRSAHAVRSLRRALQEPEYSPPPFLQDLQRIYGEAMAWIQTIADEEVKLSPEQAEEALYLVEEGEEAMDRGDFADALQVVRQVQRLSRDWWLPYRLELDALWYDGRLEETLRVGAKTAEKFPDHPGVLVPLVWAAFFGGQRALAEQYARSLKGRRYENPHMLDDAVLALGLLEDDAALFLLYQINQDLLGECVPATFMILAAAAANLKRWDVAQQIWEALADKEGLPSLTWDSPQRYAVDFKKPAPGRNSRYSTVWILPLFPPALQAEILQAFWTIENAEDAVDVERAKQQIRHLAQRSVLFFPFLANLFLEHNDYLVWAEMLLWLEKPEAEELLFRVARSPYGKMVERLRILDLLARHGKIPPGQPVDVWDENRREWRTLPVPYWEIVPASPEGSARVSEVYSAVSHFLRQKEWAKAQAKLEQMRAAQPDIVEVHLLLGDVHLYQGHHVRAMEAYRKALELDPQNLLARCAIANLYLEEEDSVAARRVLEPLFGRLRMTVMELLTWIRTMALLHFQEDDLGLAQFYVERGREINPQDEILETLGTQLDWRQYVRDAWMEEAQKRRRSIRANASLVDCLSRISKESLQATARAMPTDVADDLRKAELVRRLAEILTDPHWLGEVVAGLSSRERDALRDVLKAGGLMEWEAFTERYGDDLGENPYWGNEEPRTLMGRLRMLGLLSDGTTGGKYMVLVPKELRELLPPLLEKMA